VRYVFSIGGILAVLASIGSCALAKSAVHEAMAMLILLTGIVALGVGAILEALERIAKK
jgi:hypothetical protein